MQNCRLPIELCELAIDLIQDTRIWWDRRLDSWRWHFRACALVCSAWLPRARLHVFRTVAFAQIPQVDRFVQFITENPSYADLLHELALPATDEEYIPFVHATLVSRLRHLRSIVYTCVEFITPNTLSWHYPSRYFMLAGRYSLTELTVRFPFGSLPPAVWIQFLLLIWSLRGLQSLQLQLENIPHITPQQMSRLNASRRQWACGQLKTLFIQVSEVCGSPV